MKIIKHLIILSLFLFSCKKEVSTEKNNNPNTTVENWNILINGVSPFDTQISQPQLGIEIKDNNFILVANGYKMQGNTLNTPFIHCDIFDIFELNAQSYTGSNDVEIGYIEIFAGGHGYSNTQNGTINITYIDTINLLVSGNFTQQNAINDLGNIVNIYGLFNLIKYTK